MEKLAQSGFKAVAVSQNQFYRENLPHEEDMQMPNYDHPGASPSVQRPACGTNAGCSGP